MSEKRLEQLRRGAARYRKKHARELAQARTVTNILLRQRDRLGLCDIERLAATLRRVLGPAATLALRAALRQPQLTRRSK